MLLVIVRVSVEIVVGITEGIRLSIKIREPSVILVLREREAMLSDLR